MSGQTIAAGLAGWLEERGIRALTGWSGQERGREREPTVAVTVREFEAGSGGFGHYLGERYEEESACWVEVYGRRVELTLGLDIYAREGESEEKLQRLAEELARVLTREEPLGLRVEKLICGPCRWDEKQRRLCREVSARCIGWLEASRVDESEFLDFELRGGWKI